MIALEKLQILTPLQKLSNKVGNLGKIIVATGFQWLPKVQKIAQSGHTDAYLPTQVLLSNEGSRGGKKSLPKLKSLSKRNRKLLNSLPSASKQQWRKPRSTDHRAGDGGRCMGGTIPRQTSIAQIDCSLVRVPQFVHIYCEMVIVH